MLFMFASCPACFDAVAVLMVFLVSGPSGKTNMLYLYDITAFIVRIKLGVIMNSLSVINGLIRQGDEYGLFCVMVLIMAG